LVDLLRRYSKRADLLEDLERTLRRLTQAVNADPSPRVSAWSRGRVARPLRDRLSEADIRCLVESFRAGTIKSELAKQYGISPKSVQRLLRKFEHGDVA
jgi:DNA-binding MarR family transcriptional regulator